MAASTPYIKLITHPHPLGTLQARIDFAEVAGCDLYENPWWYEDARTKRQFYDLVACLGWPEEVKTAGGERKKQPGYAAIVGIVRPKNAEEVHYDPRNANFYILEETVHSDPKKLLSQCDEMRKRWGFGSGINKDFLNCFYGDPERFATALALTNAELTRLGGELAELAVTPPDDYNLKNRFDVYVRAINSVIQADNLRLYFGKESGIIIKNRMQAFVKDDPAVMAVGGLVHTLLGRTMWMGHRETDGAFNLKETL